jgi:putative nucleotidyltransferase with HDIG domain
MVLWKTNYKDLYLAGKCGAVSMEEQIQKLADFVHGYLMETGKTEANTVWGPKYRWEHTLRVTHWAWQLAIDERADPEKCVIAALFHDVSHFVSGDYRKHGVRSAEIAREFMLKSGFLQDFVEEIAYAVQSHVGEPSPRTIESKILQDADTLDRFGCVRILLFGKTSKLSELTDLREKAQSSLRYIDRLEKGEFGPMWTKTGEERLKELINVNKAVLNGLLMELDKTKYPREYFE